MKIEKKEMLMIRDRAIDLYRDLPGDLSWKEKRDPIPTNHHQSLAYIQAVVGVLQLDVDVEVFKRSGKGYVKF